MIDHRQRRHIDHIDHIVIAASHKKLFVVVVEFHVPRPVRRLDPFDDLVILLGIDDHDAVRLLMAHEHIPRAPRKRLPRQQRAYEKNESG